MKFTKDELWTIYFALNNTAGFKRAEGRSEVAKIYEQLAEKIEKEILK